MAYVETPPFLGTVTERIQAAYDAGVADERAAVVAWLEEYAEYTLSEKFDTEHVCTMHIMNAIHAGAHRK